MDIKEFVIGGRKAYFDRYQGGFFYYRVTVIRGYEHTVYEFSIPREDLGPGATINNEEKALTLMRWIRIALEANTMLFISTTGPVPDNPILRKALAQ